MVMQNYNPHGIAPAINSYTPSVMRRQMNSRQRILVVDDDADICRLHSEVLRYSGYDVDVVENGFAAWNALQSQSYDLIITDNNMPGITGVDLIKRLKESNIGTPVIMATGTVPDPKFNDLLLPIPVLLKPYPFADFLKTVKNVLRAHNGEDGAPPPNWDSED